MKSNIGRNVPLFGLAIVAGILATSALLFSITLLASYRTLVTEQRPLLVVELATWPMPAKQQKQEPLPQTKPQHTKAVANESPPLPIPEPASKANKIVENIPRKAMKHATLDENSEAVEESAKPNLQPPQPPAFAKSAKNALPTPVPIFQLTQAPRFLHREEPVYPEVMRARGISGVVRLEALIDKEGRVRRVNILKSAGEQFDMAARNAVLASTFYPAKIDSEPVAVLLRLPVKFGLL